MTASLLIFSTSCVGALLVLVGPKIRSDEWRMPLFAAGVTISVFSILAFIALTLGVFGDAEG